MEIDATETAVTPPRNVKLRYFTIAFVPILIFVINDMITSHLVPGGLVVSVDIVQDGRPWLEAAGRYRFLAATWLFASLIVLAIALLVRNLALPTNHRTRAVAVAVLLLILTLALRATIQKMTGQGGPGVYRHIGADVFEAVLSKGSLPGCANANDLWLLGRCGPLPVISMFNRVMDLVNLLAGLGVGALIVGMILCLENSESDDADVQAALLAKNLRHMRHQLYLSSLVLTFGMFFASSWMHWPLAMIVEVEREAYSSLLLATGFFTATYFCLLILSFYLPVALILEGRVRKLAKTTAKNLEPTDKWDMEQWLTDRGLKGDVGGHLRACFAVVAPILASFAGGIAPIVS